MAFDRRREVNRGPKLRRGQNDSPEAAGFKITGWPRERITYPAENGLLFRVSLQSYPMGHVIKGGGLRKFFPMGTEWAAMAAWCDEQAELAEAA